MQPNKLVFQNLKSSFLIIAIAQTVSERKLSIILDNPMLWIMNSLELIAFAVGLIYWGKFKNSTVKWFILFLGYNFFNEMAAAVFYVLERGADSNMIFYNFRYLIYFGLLFSLYYNKLERSKFRKAIIGLSVIWLFVYVYWLSVSNFWIQFALVPGVLGGFFLMGIILFYFVESISQRSVRGIQNDFFTYLSLGLLLESVVQLPVLITIHVGWAQITEYSDSRNDFFNTIKQVSFVASCIMYFVFMFGFYRSKGP